MKRAQAPFALLQDESLDLLLASALLPVDSLPQLSVHPALLVGRVVTVRLVARVGNSRHHCSS
jgi:hypothetical protein